MISAALLLTVGMLSSATSLRAQQAADLEQAVDAIANQAVAKKSAVGLSVGVARGDAVLLAKGYGLANIELAVPASARTVYRIGSISKQFTASAILLLVEEGKVSLDDELTRYLPEFPTQGHTLTVRHLLQHTCGIKSFTGLPSYRKEMQLDLSHEQMLAKFQDEPFDFAPGEKFRYCNSAYYLLGMIVEKASGKTYQQFCEQRLFRKLGMTSSYYDRQATIIPHRADGYSSWGGPPRNAAYLNMKQPFAAGALASTVGDLITWQRGLVAHRLLTSRSQAAMTQQGTLNDGKPIAYGLGVFVRTSNGRPVIRHGGGINGFRSDLAYYPKQDVTIVVLANSESTNPARISDQIARSLLNDTVP